MNYRNVVYRQVRAGVRFSFSPQLSYKKSATTFPPLLCALPCLVASATVIEFISIYCVVCGNKVPVRCGNWKRHCSLDVSIEGEDRF